MKDTFSLDNKEFIKFLERLAKESGKIIKKYFNGDFQVELKQDATPVTIADRKAEEKIRELIMKAFPGHGIIGEEWGTFNDDAQYVWIIDPIDGTKSFVAGVPLFGTLIGLLKDGEPVSGVIANPVLDIFLCGDNTRSLCNGQPVACRDCRTISDAVLSTTSPLTSSRGPAGNNFRHLSEQVRLYRAWGDCFGYLLLARGRIDIMLDPVMNKWDSLPLIPVIRGAGGVITTWRGEDPVTDPTNIVAASPGLHRQVIEILNKGIG
jgi:myo-inositol-1(or 4)-monophosphatase